MQSGAQGGGSAKAWCKGMIRCENVEQELIGVVDEELGSLSIGHHATGDAGVCKGRHADTNVTALEEVI